MCFFHLRKYAQITVRSTGTKWRGRCKHCGDAGSLPSFALIFFCLRELDCADFWLSHIHCEVPPTLNKMDVLNEYFGRFGPAPKFLWRKRPESTASENHAWLQRYSFSPRWANLRPVSSLQINQSRHEAVSLLALYDFVWVVRVLESCHVLLVNKTLSQSLQPTFKSPSAQSCGRPSSLLPAWRTRRRFQLSEWKNDTADHCRYSTQHDAQHAAKMSVMQKIRTKFPRYDPLILCDILWLSSSLTVFSLAPGSAIPSAKRSFNRQRLVDTSLGTVYNFFLWFTEINIVSGCGKATARNQF